jgi:hypothetical protein
MLSSSLHASDTPCLDTQKERAETIAEKEIAT